MATWKPVWWPLRSQPEAPTHPLPLTTPPVPQRQLLFWLCDNFLTFLCSSAIFEYRGVCPQYSLVLPGFALYVKESYLFLTIYRWHWSRSHILATMNKATGNVFVLIGAREHEFLWMTRSGFAGSQVYESSTPRNAADLISKALVRVRLSPATYKGRQCSISWQHSGTG